MLKGQYTNPYFDGTVMVKRGGKNLKFLICGCVDEDGNVKLCNRHKAELSHVCREDVVSEPIVVECEERIEGLEFMAGPFDALWKSHTPIVMEYTSSTHHDANRRVLPVSPVWLDWKNGTRKFFAVDASEFEACKQDYIARRKAWIAKGQSGPQPVFVGPPTKTFFANEARKVRVQDPLDAGNELVWYAKKTHAYRTYSSAQ
jgi:hypothetical protein